MKFNIAFIGFGVVGQGLAQILLENKNTLREKYNFEYEVVAVSDPVKGSLYKKDGLNLEELLKKLKDTGSIRGYPGAHEGFDSLTTIKSTNADIIIEVTPTNLDTGEPGLSHIRTALTHKRHVVTTNKGPVALAYPELRALAEVNGVHFRFEGTVLSGTPALNLGINDLAGAGINSIRGILNGTTNYILDEMEKGRSYEDALREAQARGYAEADPAADVEGWDAVGKIVILANIIMNFGGEGGLTPKAVERKGIVGLTGKDVEAAARAGKKIKLIARAWYEGGVLKAKVSPEEVPLEDPLANINGVLNAITFSTDLLGDVTVIGPGAGGREAGYALLTDMLAINRLVHPVSPTVPPASLKGLTLPRPMPPKLPPHFKELLES